MINEIALKNIKPSVFLPPQVENSGVWNTDLVFDRGKSYLIKSNSGKGKSSLCNFIYGNRKDYDGEILFNCINISKLTKSEWDHIRQKDISLMYQDLLLFPELTALENVFVKNNLTQHKNKNQIKNYFERLGVIDKIDSPAKIMSVGQLQRVAFIRSICQPFSFILLDEPISHLDKDNAKIMSEILTEELKANNASAIVTTVGNNLPIDYNVEIEL